MVFPSLNKESPPPRRRRFCFFPQRVVVAVVVMVMVMSAMVGMGDASPPSCEDPGNNTLTSKKLKVGVILPLDNTSYWPLPLTRFAVEFALDTVRSQQLLPGWTILTDYRDSKCSEAYGPLEAIDMVYKRNGSALVFLGPACDFAVAPIARFTRSWGIPIITAGGFVKAFEDKQMYPLLTRLMGSYAKAAEFVIEIFKHFKWTEIGMMYQDKHGEGTTRSNCHFIMEALFFSIFLYTNKEPWYERFDEDQIRDSDKYGDLLNQARLHTRMVVLCASPDSVREIMIKARDLNFDNGEYVFFNIDLFTSKTTGTKPWYRENDTDERNEKAKKAYEALMTVTLRKPTSPEYKAFSKTVKERAEHMYQNFTYGEEEVNSFVGAFHDAVILYALALNESLEAGIPITNGSEITQRMWNRTFEGITGTVSIDANGDRNADYSLLDLDPETDTFQVVANYYGNKKKYEPVVGRRIAWAGGKDEPPTDTPKCGFDGSKCPPDEPFPEYGIVIIVLGTIIFIVLIAAFFIYRKYKRLVRKTSQPDDSDLHNLRA